MGVSAAVVGGAVIGGVASNAAADKQANAAGKAADMSADAAAQMRADLGPYTSLGNQAINPLWSAMGYIVNPDGTISVNPNATLQQQFSFNPQDLQTTPGYQFALQQGMRQVNNSAASRGLGLSGAQLKGATSFATGLADQTYGNQFNRALSQFNTNYQVASNNVNNLQNLVNTGQNSAAQTGQAALSGANNAGNYLTQGANAQAAGIMGTANAVNSGVGNYLTYNALYGNGGGNNNTFGGQVGNYLSR